MHDRHFDDECKQIIDKCIYRFVSHCPPVQMSHTLELVIDEKLWRHRNETKHIDETDKSIEDPGVIPLVALMDCLKRNREWDDDE